MGVEHFSDVPDWTGFASSPQQAKNHPLPSTPLPSTSEQTSDVATKGEDNEDL